MTLDFKQRPFLGVALIALTVTGVILWPGIVVAQSADAVSSVDRQQIIEQRLREIEASMKSAATVNEPAAVNTEAPPNPVDAVDSASVPDEPLPDARQSEHSKKVERAQAAREDKLKIRQVKKMLHDARAVHRAGLQQDARDQLNAIAQFLRSDDFPENQREHFQKQLIQLSRAVDEKAEQQSRRVKVQVFSESDSESEKEVKVAAPSVSAAQDMKPVRAQSGGLEISRQQAQESLSQLESARELNARAPSMDSPAGREVVRKKEELADDFRRQRDSIILEQKQAQERLDKGIQDLYRRGEDHFKRGALDQARQIFEDIELLSPGYQKTADYLEKIQKR